MKYLMIILALSLAGCDQRTHYVYPGFVQKAIELCAVNGGIEQLVITSSRRPGHINAGAWGYVDCKNTAHFKFHIKATDQNNGWEQNK